MESAGLEQSVGPVLGVLVVAGALLVVWVIALDG
jgi:hypothetical protein